MPDPQHEPLMDTVASLTGELLTIRVERANLNVDLSEVTVLVQWIKDDVGKSFSGASTEVQMTYEDVVDAVKLKIQRKLVER